MSGDGAEGDGVKPAPKSEPASWDEPTQAYAFDQAASTLDETQPYSFEQETQPYSIDAAVTGMSEPPRPVGLPQPADEAPTTSPSAIDSLFGEGSFKEYEPGALPSEAFTPIPTPRPRVAAEPMTSTQRTLLIVAAGLVALAVLVGIFVLGTRFPGLIPEQDAAPAPATTVAPVAAAPAIGPVAEGEHEWSALLGTECLDPFPSAWEQKYTVVDCTTPHAAQLVYRGMFADESYAPYPGIDALQARINLLCTTPTSLDYTAAGALDDIAVSASYAASAGEWDAGDRSFFCFLTRSSGEPITVSLANAPVADPGPVPSIPGLDP